MAKNEAEIGSPEGAVADAQSHKRAAPRMDLSLPAQFLGVEGNHRCIITNLSRTGLRIAIKQPLRVGQEGFLRGGPIDHFMAVTRAGTGMNALEFEIPVSDIFVFGIRRFQEQFEEREAEELMATVRAWTSGEDAGPI